MTAATTTTDNNDYGFDLAEMTTTTTNENEVEDYDDDSPLYTMCGKCGDLVYAVFGNNYYWAYTKCPTCGGWVQYKTVSPYERE